MPCPVGFFEPNCEEATPSIFVVRFFEFVIATVVFAIPVLVVVSAFTALLVVVVSAFAALLLAFAAVFAFVATLGFLRFVARLALLYRVLRRNLFVLRPL